MVSSTIWVVVFAQPRNKSVKLRDVHKKRCEAVPGLLVDLMYPNRFAQSMALKEDDRIVVHFGGSFDPQAQHLVQAGYVRHPAREMTKSDIATYPALSQITAKGFPGFEIDPKYPELIGRQGIIVYRVFEPQLEVGILARPYKQPRIGQNFIPILLGMPEYGKINDWWNKVVPGDQVPV
jgi:hypothetical protein